MFCVTLKVKPEVKAEGEGGAGCVCVSGSVCKYIFWLCIMHRHIFSEVGIILQEACCNIQSNALISCHVRVYYLYLFFILVFRPSVFPL